MCIIFVINILFLFHLNYNYRVVRTNLLKKKIKIKLTVFDLGKEQNEIIVKFAEVCVELSYINKRLNQHRTLLGYVLLLLKYLVHIV